MEYIYHEKQDGLLCAQHCLNNLLQNSYFTAVDLGTIGRGLDALEANFMAERGYSTEEFRRFSEHPSENMDDSGFFSVQVIQKALESFGITLASYDSPQSLEAKEHPERSKAFICNHDAHWIAIRKIGTQWFNLNSLLSAPELISDLHLSLFLTQLSLEGYTIFVAQGALPDCEADQVLQLMKATQTTKPSFLESDHQHTHTQDYNAQSIEDEELQAAIAMSLTDGTEAKPDDGL
ncbi:ataxin-3-like [Watersipora subatra]|uniref:ataxin-3-like n=1 Tax=Watersipora subatra TaxID=2589382 RepID=UPI00355AE4DE